MATIEERAEELTKQSLSSVKDTTITDLLIKFAKEQEAITKQEIIKKACEMFCKCCSAGKTKNDCPTDCLYSNNFKKLLENA